MKNKLKKAWNLLNNLGLYVGDMAIVGTGVLLVRKGLKIFDADFGKK